MNEAARKPIVLFIAVLVLCFILLAMLSTFLQKGDKAREAKSTPTTTPLQLQKGANATATLLAVSTKSQVSQGEEFSINIIIQTGENIVTGVQAEIQYDSSVLSITKIAPGDFFAKPLELANKNDSAKGEIIYAVGSFDGVKGGGVIAKITAKALKKTNGSVEVLTIKPTTLISAFDAKQSVLKEGRGASLVIR